MIAATAESNRSPFDLPEGESEIIAGYYIEYSGFKFALFFLGEYLGMFATSGMAITLFLGGWSAPFSFLTWIPSYVWFFAKLLALICVFIWIRGTLPAPAHGPADGLRLEVHAAHGAAQHVRPPASGTSCRAASCAGSSAAPSSSLPGMLLSRSLKQNKKLADTHLSLRRMKHR